MRLSDMDKLRRLIARAAKAQDAAYRKHNMATSLLYEAQSLSWEVCTGDRPTNQSIRLLLLALRNEADSIGGRSCELSISLDKLTEFTGGEVKW